MTISDFLSPTNVTLDVQALNKSRFIRDLATVAAGALNLPADHVAAELLKREKLGSTGTGGGVAIPHARIGIMKPFGALAKLRQPIDFDAIDGQPVDLVFVLLLPEGPADGQLGALASVARKLRASETIAQLRPRQQRIRTLHNDDWIGLL
jgi:PTS system nitrogen regulatory IIA component